MSEKVKIAIIVSLGIIIASSLGTFLNIQYKKDIEQTKEGERNLAKSRYERCLNTAISGHNSMWNNHCSDIGRDYDCMLPTYAAKEYAKKLESDKNQCLSLYEAELK